MQQFQRSGDHIPHHQQQNLTTDQNIPQIITQSSDGVGGGGGRNDYFAYISANQQYPNSRELPILQPSISTATIPEIRLAPPNNQNDNNNDNVNISNEIINNNGLINQEQQQQQQEQIKDDNSDDDGDDDQPSISVALPVPDPSTTIQLYPSSVPDFLNNGAKPNNVIVGPFSISIQHFLKLEEIYNILFPTLQDWANKTAFAKLSSLIALPLVFIFTITLPVVESDDIKVDDYEVIIDEYPPPSVGGVGGGGLNDPINTNSFYQRQPLSSDHISSHFLATSNLSTQPPPMVMKPSSSTATNNGFLSVPDKINGGGGNNYLSTSSSSSSSSSISNHFYFPSSNNNNDNNQHQHHHQHGLDCTNPNDLDDQDLYLDVPSEWIQWLTILQAIMACTFVFTVMAGKKQTNK